MFLIQNFDAFVLAYMPLLMRYCTYSTEVTLRALIMFVKFRLHLFPPFFDADRSRKSPFPARLNSLSLHFSQTMSACPRLELRVIAVPVCACAPIERHETRSDTSREKRPLCLLNFPQHFTSGSVSPFPATSVHTGD